MLANGARPVTAQDAIVDVDVVILSIPLSASFAEKGAPAGTAGRIAIPVAADGERARSGNAAGR